MILKKINLSVIEDKPSKIPEQIFWQTSQDIAQNEIDTIKKRYQQYEAEILQQLAAANAAIEILTRENKSLQVDINHKNDALKNAAVQKNIFEETIAEQEHEVKHLTEDVGRSSESAENLKRRLYEVNRQLEQESAMLKESREDAAVNLRTSERIDKDLKVAIKESKNVWEKLKDEQRRGC